ncbi:MAG: SDR family oxidoreductase [Thaumarchaeota archaeon]|nr:SDR family oxidoreductase [Nitrososphaerota archaeon]
MRLQGRVAIVTGASAGIGNGIARRFAQEGARLAVTQHKGPLTELERYVDSIGGEVLVVKADTSSTEDVNRFVAATVERYGRVDIACSVAGSLSWARVEDITDEEWDRIMQSDLFGTFRLVRAVLPTMKKQRYGRIVLTSSIEGKAIGWPGRVHYCANKGGIDAMTRALALEVARDGITVNALAPGPVESRMIRSKASLGVTAAKNLASYIPVGYMGLPEDVAGLALYLASEESRFLTGQSIVIDGGYTIGPVFEVPGQVAPPSKGKIAKLEDP